MEWPSTRIDAWSIGLVLLGAGLVRSYCRAHWQRAWGDTRRFLWDNLIWGVSIAILSALIWSAIRYYTREPKEMSAIVLPLVVTLSALGIFCVIVFIFNLCATPFRIYRDDQQAIASLQDQVLNRSARLTVKFTQDSPYRRVQNQRTFYRVGIFNDGPAVAENVEMWLDAITPRPRSQLFPGDFPYRVTREGLAVVEMKGCEINPKGEQLFEIARSWVSGEGRLIVDGIETKRPLAGWAGAALFEMERDEQWKLMYRIMSANAQPVHFTLGMGADGDTLSIYDNDLVGECGLKR